MLNICSRHKEPERDCSICNPINTDLLLPGMLFRHAKGIVEYHSACYDVTGKIDSRGLCAANYYGGKLRAILSISDLSPIPLTAEILRDWFGFLESDDAETRYRYEWKGMSFETFGGGTFYVDRREVFTVDGAQLQMVAYGLDHRVSWDRIKEGGKP